jgi:hypothetical protein
MFEIMTVFEFGIESRRSLTGYGNSHLPSSLTGFVEPFFNDGNTSGGDIVK